MRNPIFVLADTIKVRLEFLMKIRHLPSLIIAFFVSACGGGGGSAPPATVPPPPPPPAANELVIDAANAKPAVRVAYGATVESMGTGETVGGAGISMSPGDDFSKPFVGPAMPGALTRVMQKDLNKPLIGLCLGGAGTETVTGNIAVLGTLTAGDTINIAYMDCDTGFGEVLNGRIETTVAVFSGDLISGLFLLDTQVLLIDFEIATAADTITSNGDFSASIDTTGTPLVLLSISGDMLTVVSMAGTDTLTDFSTSQTVDATPPVPYTLSSSGTVNSTQLSGVISYTTPVTFQGVGDAYPFAGELLVTGDGNATIRLIALDATNVRIETDSNGDGVVDSTENTTWDDVAL